MKRILLLIPLFIVLIFVLGFAHVKKKPHLNQDKSAITTENNTGKDGLSENTLGKNTRRSEIIISGGKDNYGRGGLISLASTDEPAVYISSYNLNGASTNISIYEADENALLNYLLHDKEYNQINKVDITKFKLITTFEENLKSGNGSENKVMLPLKKTGVFFLRVEYESSLTDAFVIRSNIGGLLKEAENSFVFWAQDFESLKSISGGTVKIYNLTDSLTEISSASIDPNGIAKLPITDTADIALITKGDDRTVIPINLRYLNSYNYKSYQKKNPATKYFIFTDRPIYKPGDTVYFKAVIREDDDARYSIPFMPVKTKIYKDWDEKNTVFEKDYVVSSDGTVYGEYILDPQAGSGNYQLKMTLQNKIADSDIWNNWTDNTISFMVEYYRKPEYGINITVPQNEFVSSDPANFTISGKYFSGQPLSGQKVKYKIYSSNYYDYEYFSDTSFTSDNDFRYGWWGQNKITENETVLDQKGDAKINLDTKIPDKEGKSMVFSIEAEYDNGSGNPSYTRKNILVYAGEYDIFRKNFSFGFKTNQEINLPLVAVSRNNSKASGILLKAKIVRENWVSYQETDKKYPSFRKETENLPDQSLTTDQDGNANLSFVAKMNGSYQIKVEGKDTKNNLISKTFYIWVNDNNTYYYSDIEGQNLKIITDKSRYSPNETVTFNISSSVPDRDLFLSIERGRMDRYEIIRLNGKSATVSLPLKETDIPNIFAHVSGFSDSYLDTNSINIPVSTDMKKLAVSVESDRKKYGPGDNIMLNIRSFDNSGNPLPAETSVRVVDKAIFELASENYQNIFDTFWMERGNNTLESHSLEGISARMAEGGGCFAENTKILIGNGAHQEIQNIKAGDIILTKENENTNKLVQTKVKNVHFAKVSGYLILNRDLRVTPEHILWINNKWSMAGNAKIGDILIDEKGDEKEISSIEWIKGNFKVYNLEIEKYATFFAGGYFVHNQKGGGDTRSLFKDTAYWNPSIHTDASGRAEVSFKLPDNLTTYVVAIVGSTKDTKVGQNSSEIIVSKDIIIRPILPNILSTDDKITVSALVQNFSANDDTFDIDLDFDSGEIKKATYSGIAIKSNETKQVYFDIVPQKENPKARLTLSARSNRFLSQSDTVISKIPVKTFGFFDYTGQTGNGPSKFPLTLSPDALNRKTKITLSLSPTTIGTLTLAMNYLVDYPYGCVEQTTSRFIPALIAKANPDLFSKSIADKNIDSIINEGIKRLAILQQADGGWPWWFSGYSNPFITAYVVEYLFLAKNLGYPVDDEILQKVTNFLEQYTSSPNNRDTLIAKTYALSFLDSEKGKNKLDDFTDIDPDILSLAVITNIKNGITNPEINGLNKLLSMQKIEGDGVYWKEGKKENFGTKDVSTALAIQAITTSGTNRDTAVKGAKFLTRNKKSNYWSNTFATAHTIRSLVDLSKTGSEIKPDYTYSVLLDGNLVVSGKVTNFKDQITDINLDTGKINPQGSVIDVKIEGTGQIYSTLVTKQFHTDKNSKALASPLKVKREYTNEKGPDLPLSVGETAVVSISVSGLSTDENYGVIEDQLPSGMIPINEKLKNEQFGDGNNQNSYDYYAVNDKEITENGIIMSVHKLNEQPRTYTYRARIISAGEFTVPPATAMLMYSPEISGRSDTQTIKTTDNRDTDSDSKPVITTTPSDSNNKILDYKNIKPIISILIFITFLGIITGAYVIRRKFGK